MTAGESPILARGNQCLTAIPMSRLGSVVSRMSGPMQEDRIVRATQYFVGGAAQHCTADSGPAVRGHGDHVSPDR